MPRKPNPSSAKQRGTISTSCEQHLLELAAFKQQHGHCNVPHTYPPNQRLANWVTYVRGQKKSGAIVPELACCLERLGFSWVLVSRSVRRHAWDAMVAALTAFKEEHGHCCVPWGAKYRQLATWVVNIRRRTKKGLLDHRRVQQLDRLGFAWEPRKQRWEEMLSALVEYKVKHGDCNVPYDWPENPRLGRWVQTLRTSRKHGKLTQARIRQLDGLGFVWSRQETSWHSMYGALAEYQRAHGHCRVSTLDKQHARLGNWVRTQRYARKKGKLSEERIRLLDQLGFVWEAPLKGAGPKGKSEAAG